MTDSLLPTAAEKPSQTQWPTLFGSKVMRLVTLLTLVSITCLGSGLFLFQAGLLSSEAPRLDITQLQSSYTCPIEDGMPEHRVCIFADVIVWEHYILYLYSGEQRPVIPDILVNWHHDYHFQINVTHVSELSERAKAANVVHIKAATFVWRKWHLNWYHGIGESLYETYNSACQFLHYCGGSRNSTELQPVFIEKPGDEEPWEVALPPLAEALKCIFPSQAYWLGDNATQHKVLYVQKGAAGIGLYNRKWQGYIEEGRDKGQEFKKIYGRVDRHISQSYRALLIQCYNVKFPTFTPDGPYEVTLVNRQYHKGRSMVNLGDVFWGLMSLPEVSDVKLAYMETLTFRQQLEVYATAQVLVMGHGAAFANLLFMAPESVVVIYNWLPEYTEGKISPHSWIIDYMADLALPVNFVGTSTTDRRLIYPMKEKYVFEPEFQALSVGEKVALLERGICPSRDKLECLEMKDNFAVDWDVLERAMQQAFLDLHTRHTHILDGTGGRQAANPAVI